MSIPNFNPVSIEEVIQRADKMLAVAYPDDASDPIQRWVNAINAERAAAKAAFEVEPFDLAGVTVKPGDLVHLTITPRYSKGKRSLNCLIVDRIITAHYDGRAVNVRYRAYGAKMDTWPRDQHVPLSIVTKVEPQATIPEAIVALEVERQKYHSEAAERLTQRKAEVKA